MDIAERLAALVKERGLNPKKVGDATGISNSFIGHLCKGNKELKGIDTAIKLADFFGVSLDYLLCRSDERGVSIRKEPRVDVSESGRQMLSYFEQLPDLQKGELIGEAKSMAKLLRAVENEEKKKDARAL